MLIYCSNCGNIDFNKIREYWINPLNGSSLVIAESVAVDATVGVVVGAAVVATGTFCLGTTASG